MTESENVNMSIYDEVELHTDCTVQILKNSVTGEISIGWWDNAHPPARVGEEA